MKDEWTQKVLDARENPKAADELRKELMIMAYHFRTGRKYEDDQADFLIFFLPRLERILRNFEDIGVPFLAFYRKCMLWEFLSYMRTKGDRSRLSGVLNLDLPDADIHAALEKENKKSPGVNVKTIFKVKKENPDSQKRRFFLFLLKMSEYLPEGAVERFCVTTGYDASYVYETLQKLKDLNQFRIARLQKMRELRDVNYSEWMIRERSAYGEQCPERKYLVQKKASMYKHRRDRLNALLSRVKCYPQHKDIASLTGIPKGTVDSGIHHFRQKANYLSDADAS